MRRDNASQLAIRPSTGRRALALLLVSLQSGCIEVAIAERRAKAVGQRPGPAVNMTVDVDLPNAFAINLTRGTSNDRVELADNAALECGTQCSFGLRVHADTENSTHIYLSKWDQAGTSRSIQIDCGTVVDTHCNVRINLCPDATCATQWVAQTRAGAPGTVPTSIVVTLNFATATARMYIDGAHYPNTNVTGTFPGAWANSTAAWTWGARQAGDGTREIDGQIDDFWIDPDYEWSPRDVWLWHNKRGSARLPAGITTAYFCRAGDDTAGVGNCPDYFGSGLSAQLLGTAAAYQAAVHTKIPFEAADTLNWLRQVLLFLGQSNLSGRGLVSDFGASQDDEFPNRGDCWIYDNNGPQGTPDGTVNPAIEPVDDNTGQAAGPWPISDDASTVGPMLATCNRLAALWPNHEIGMVPCPLGGTEAGEWTWTRAVDNFLWGECEERWASAALGAATAEVACAVIYQGEQNAQNAFERDTWRYQWASACEGIRDSLGERDVPCVFVRLPPTVPSGTYTEWANLRAEQATICSLLDHCAVVDAPDGPYVGAGDVHLATGAHVGPGQLGERIADACFNAAYGQGVTP